MAGNRAICVLEVCYTCAGGVLELVPVLCISHLAKSDGAKKALLQGSRRKMLQKNCRLRINAISLFAKTNVSGLMMGELIYLCTLYS
jgi:hypothetical protein